MSKKALLLLNMGGPNNLSEVRTFLTNMFNDHRIIGAPKLIRKVIAWIITSKRVKEATHNYQQLGGCSPIIKHTQALVKDLKDTIDADVHYVMRYTAPYTKDILNQVKEYDEIYAIPLYPHFSSTTTLSSYDALYDEANKLGIANKIKKIDFYYSNSSYINASIERIKEVLGSDDPTEFELVFSAHGLPKKIIDNGDLYQKHIRYNVYYLRKALVNAGIIFHKTHLAYQSRLGPMEWIRPYLEDKLQGLNKKKVIIYPVAFTVDNSETEFELSVEYEEKAKEYGITDYRVSKAPNNHPLFVKAIAELYSQLKS